MGAPGAGSTGREASERSLRSRLLSGLIDGLTWIVERIPLSASAALARGFGRGWAALSAPRTGRVRAQLATAFPTHSPRDHEAWTRGVFEHLAQGLVELLALRGARAAALLDQVEVEGLEHLRAAEAQTERGGVLVVTAHLGNWELACAKVAALGIPVSVVYRGLREPALDQVLLDLRGRTIGEKGAGDASSVQQIRMGHAGLPVVRALESGRKVITLLDQDAKREEGVFVSFFGRLASTRSGPVELAMARNVPIVPAFIRRGANGQGHRVEIGPAIPLVSNAADPAQAIRANVQRVTEAIEAAIRAEPSQWIWTHRRWRTQPREEDGAPAKGELVSPGGNPDRLEG